MSSKRNRDETPEQTGAPPLAVVGLGVCTRSFASLEALFGDLPDNLGAVYVVAVRQQDGLQVDAVVEALSRRSKMPVTVAGDGERLEANHIYVGGRDALITVQDGHVRSSPTEAPVSQRGTVDTLLLSIAESQNERTVAVILDGLGSDGTAGVAATKSCGGLAIAERVNGEESAAEAITAIGIADLRLPVAEIPGQIATYIRGLARLDEAGGWPALQEEASAQIGRIAAILRQVTGNDFHGYKQNTFLRRVARRMQVVGLEHIEPYIERLGSDVGEVQHLFQDLLIGVTQFFRDAPEFEVIERDVIPAIFDGKGRDDRVRVWVVGCATGEEAYSLAILLREHMERMENPPEVQIFATDLDARALAIARAGRYPENLAGQITAERLARWFVKEGATYCVSKHLREMCIFSPQNVLKDAPFSRIDLLSCRNLLIYLNGDLQGRVIPIFHFSLAKGGFLFLGNAENITRHPKLFAPVDRKNRVYRKLETSARVLPEFPLSSRGPRAALEAGTPTSTPRRGMGGAVGRKAEQAAERFAPAYVVVDEQGEVLHFSGRTGRFLEPAAGTASLNVISLVHRDLRLDLRSALARATVQDERVETPRLPLTIEGQTIGVHMVVEPINGPGEPSALIVLFQESGPLHPESARHGEYTDEQVQRLEAELHVTKDRLQATIEELESTNEELKSSNEEYQSINEELQSANEELETSKEELQSVNEELQTVNHELASRVAELGRTNSDLKNLLESTQIATVFLDNDLRIRGFTPTAMDVFHLIETDVGRPISHIASRVAYPELQDDARRVIRSLGAVEREVTSPEDRRRFLVRLLPYRSTENVIAGAVVTFMDVTAAARAEAALAESEERFRAFVNASSVAIYRMSPDWSEMIEFDGRGFMPDTPNRTVGWVDRYILAEDRPKVEQAIASSIKAKSSFTMEHRVRRLDGSLGWVLSRAEPMIGPDGAIVEWFGAAADITGRVEAESRQSLLLAELQHRVRNVLSIVRSIGRRTAASSRDVADYASRLDGRLNALSRTQAAVTRDPTAGVDLGQIAGDELASYTARDGGQARLGGPSLPLKPKAAESLGLAFHELATNSIKYGALSSPNGQLDVEWGTEKADGAAELVVRWRETSDTISGEPPARRGFGTELLERTLAYDLKASTRLEFEPGAFSFELRCPADLTVF